MTEILYKNSAIEKDEKESCLYGIQITTANLINFVIAFGIGFWRESLLEIAVFYVVFVSLRFFCGGYHAKNYGRCFCLFAITCVLHLVVSNVIMVYVKNGVWLWLAAMILLGICIFVKAPIEHKNRPFTTDERALFRKRSIQLYLVWSFAGTIAWLCSVNRLLVCFISVFLIIFIYMLIERGENDEKESA